MAQYQRHGTVLACVALFLAAAGPEPSPDVKQVPPEEAMTVLGQTVTDAQGKDVGRLVDLLIGADGEPQAAVIDFGGFMGVGSRKIAVRWSALHFAPADKAHPIVLEWSPDQIKAAPEYKNVTKAAPVVVAPPATPAAAPAASPAAAPAATPQ